MKEGALPTRASLLIRVKDLTDQTAWSEFVELYSPLVYQYARYRGLQDADAADVVQEVMQDSARSIPVFEYSPDRGSFRGWLYTLALNRIRGKARKSKRQVQGTGNTKVIQLLNEQPDGQDIDDHWNRQHEMRLFEWAAEQVKSIVKPRTWEAFERVVIQGQSCEVVAEKLEMSVGAVYIAKSRVISRIREKIKTVESQSS